MKTRVYIFILILLGIAGLSFFLRSKPLPPAEQKLLEGILKTPSINTPVFEPVAATGPLDAKVTVYVFFDDSFPPSQEASKTLEKVIERYGDQIRFSFVPFPREPHCFDGESSCTWAKRLVCAQGWEQFAKIHASQISNSEESPKKEIEQMSKCAQSPSTLAHLRDYYSLANKIEIFTPPSFLIQGRRVEGGIPFEVWNRLLSELLSSK